MEVLLVPLSDFLFLPFLFSLECNHPIVHFREKEMQNQRHEVCLKYIRFGVMESWSIGVLEIADFGFRNEERRKAQGIGESLLPLYLVPCTLDLFLIWREARDAD